MGDAGGAIPRRSPFWPMAAPRAGAETGFIATGATMQPQLHVLTQDSVHQMRDTLRRVTSLHAADRRLKTDRRRQPLVEIPKPDEAAWEDTEMDVRRVVL